MKYLKHIRDGRFAFFSFEGDSTISFPEAPGNKEYDTMMKEVEAGTSSIEEIDDGPG